MNYVINECVGGKPALDWHTLVSLYIQTIAHTQRARLSTHSIHGSSEILRRFSKFLFSPHQLQTSSPCAVKWNSWRIHSPMGR